MTEGGQIKILIIDDIPETCDYLSKLLHFERDIQVVGTANSGEQGLAKARELQPDIALIDINMPGMDGIQITEKMLGQATGTQVIIMSVQGEQDYLRRAWWLITFPGLMVGLVTLGWSMLGESLSEILNPRLARS